MISKRVGVVIAVILLVSMAGGASVVKQAPVTPSPTDSTAVVPIQPLPSIVVPTVLTANVTPTTNITSSAPVPSLMPTPSMAGKITSPSPNSFPLNMVWAENYLVDTAKQMENLASRYPAIVSIDWRTVGSQKINGISRGVSGSSDVLTQYIMVPYDSFIQADYLLNNLTINNKIELTKQVDMAVQLLNGQLQILARIRESVVSYESAGIYIAVIDSYKERMSEFIARLQLVSNRLHGLPDEYKPSTGGG